MTSTTNITDLYNFIIQLHRNAGNKYAINTDKTELHSNLKTIHTHSIYTPVNNKKNIINNYVDNEQAFNTHVSNENNICGKAIGMSNCNSFNVEFQTI